MEGFDKNEEMSSEEVDRNANPEIYSKVVRAGNRTYFFDVKSTRGDEYYLTITESRKRFRNDGRYFYEKHKVFLYREDFDNFMSAFYDSVDFIKEEQPIGEADDAETDPVPAGQSVEVSGLDVVEDEEAEEVEVLAKDYTKVEFEDLNS